MYKKIVAPLDGSKLAECVLPHVEAIAKGCGATEIALIRVVEPPRLPAAEEGGPGFIEGAREKVRQQWEDDLKNEASAYLDRIARQRPFSNLNLRREVLLGQPADAIAAYAEKSEADLIVIATHGLTGLSRWTMGSVADRVLRASCVPVLMVRAPGCIPGF